VLDSTSMLQLGTKWWVDEETQAALRDAIHTRYPALDPSQIELRPAPVSVDRVSLDVGDGSGNRFDELATSPSSGFPPYQAVFATQLKPDAAARAANAVAGGANYVRVSYHVSASVPLPATIHIAGDVSGDLAALPLDASLDDARTRIAAGIDAGRLSVTRSDTAGVPEAFWARLLAQAQETAAQDLLRLAKAASSSPMSNSPDSPSVTTASIDTTASDSYPQTIALLRSADVSSWFPNGTGASHVQVMSASGKT
jgi:hypothetical protein